MILPLPEWTHAATLVVGGVLGYAAKALELFKLVRGPRITVDAIFTSSEMMGHTVTITNHSDKPLLIKYWSLVNARRYPWIRPRDAEVVTEPDFDDTRLRVPAHDRTSLEFCEDRYFRWETWTKARPLYLRMRLEGAIRDRYFNLSD